MTTHIYTLRDPNTNEIRYVGKSNDVQHRLTNHIRHTLKTVRKNHTQCWIYSLLNKGQRPIVEVLEVVPMDDWQYWEQYWIAQLKAWGIKLTNTTPGGEGVVTNKDKKLEDTHKKNISAGVRAAHKAKPGHNITPGHPKHLKSFDKDMLFDLYVTQKKMLHQMSAMLGCVSSTVWKHLKRHDII